MLKKIIFSLFLLFVLSACDFKADLGEIQNKTKAQVDEIKNATNEVKENIQTAKENVEQKIEDVKKAAEEVNEVVEQMGEATDAIKNVVKSEEKNEVETGTGIEV